MVNPEHLTEATNDAEDKENATTALQGPNEAIPIEDRSRARNRKSDLIYGIQHAPPIYLCVILGLQDILWTARLAQASANPCPAGSGSEAHELHVRQVVYPTSELGPAPTDARAKERTYPCVKHAEAAATTTTSTPAPTSPVLPADTLPPRSSNNSDDTPNTAPGHTRTTERRQLEQRGRSKSREGRVEEEEKLEDSTTRLAEKWLHWQSHQLGVPIRHRLNHTEKRIGDSQLTVDGLPTSTAVPPSSSSTAAITTTMGITRITHAKNEVYTRPPRKLWCVEADPSVHERTLMQQGLDPAVSRWAVGLIVQRIESQGRCLRECSDLASSAAATAAVEDAGGRRFSALSFQQLLMALAGALSLSMTLAEVICARVSDNIRSTIFSSTLFMCGLCTILQSAIGVRLPIFQGASNSFLLPLLALRSVPSWQCAVVRSPVSGFNSSFHNVSSNEMSDDTVHETAMLWKLRQLQGSLVVTSFLQFLLGITGTLGFLMRFIGPITVVPTISLIGLSLFKVVLLYAPTQWGITILTIGLIIVFTIFMKEIHVPLPSYTRQTGCTMTRFPLFKVFPIILSVMIVWFLCYVLTMTNVFPPDKLHPSYFARTDVRKQLLRTSPWVYFPYPGQYGTPSFNAGAFIGMIAATIASTLESIGDYYACAKVCYVPPPPKHAINRGIALEGFGSMISGLLGTAHGTTSYSGNIGAIGITKVASRRVFYVAGVLTIILSIIGKVAAVLVSIPHPILGGVQSVIFGILAAIGLSGLQFVDLSSSRNLIIVGISMFLGLLLPEWISRSPRAINSGNAQFDQVLTVFLGTPMFIGGVIALILDNVAPGTIEERGLHAWQTVSEDSARFITVYDLPMWITNVVNRFKVSRYLPFLPVQRSPEQNKDYNE
ncbi:solute carrier family 23 member 1-like [Liolophura sinensis]|uniref:solute carrier family 23 member 1-like n=1 Tax=Liolophura sinensis TaxID=3198878 RepID=UPI00315843C6